MSIILITEHDESIYNTTIDESAKYRRTKSPRYISRFRQPRPKSSVNVFRTTYATMGLPKQPLPNPSEFLKKHSRKEYKVILTTTEQPKTSKLAPVPATADLLEADKTRKKSSSTNFITRNVKKVLAMKPKDPEKKVVIDGFGMAKKLSAGLEPQYIYNCKFGKTPNYLTRFIKTKKREMQTKQDFSESQQPKCKYITQERREELLAGLKQNWEELQQRYQGLPILTDTIPKIIKKCKLESDLKQLEKDIVLLERHPYIYVFDDDDVS